MIFQHFPHTKVCHKKVKSQPMTIIWTNLVDLESPMLCAMIQPQTFLGSGEEDFYMSMAAILFNGVEPFKQIVNTLSTEGPMWNLVKIAPAVSEMSKGIKAMERTRMHLRTDGWTPCWSLYPPNLLVRG